MDCIVSAAAPIAVIIPARFASTRFPGKPLTTLNGADGRPSTLIERSWQVACAAMPPDRIWVATDDDRIEAVARGVGAQVVRTPTACRNGTERCWHAISQGGIDADIVINLQGDAPLTPPRALSLIAETLREDPAIAVATPMVRCSDSMVDRLLADDRAGHPGGTTVVFDGAMNALYFSKRPLPFVPDHGFRPPVFLHMGLYGYRRTALEHYAALPPSPLEVAEGLEQLRFLHAGIAIRLIEVGTPPGGLWEVNYPADIARVEQALAERHIHG